MLCCQVATNIFSCFYRLGIIRRYRVNVLDCFTKSDILIKIKTFKLYDIYRFFDGENRYIVYDTAFVKIFSLNFDLFSIFAIPNIIMHFRSIDHNLSYSSFLVNVSKRSFR